MMTAKRPKTIDEYKRAVFIGMSVDPRTVHMTKLGPSAEAIMDLATKGMERYGVFELGIRAPAVWCGAAADTLNVLGLLSLQGKPFLAEQRVASNRGPIPVLFKLTTREDWPSNILWLEPIMVDVPGCADCGDRDVPHVH